MMARRGVLGILAGGAAALLSGCGLIGGNSYRFKMTVEVETPQGVKTGSSVYEVSAFKTSELITGGGSSDSTLKGEAVAVDLPDGKTLFALLRMANGTSGDDNLAIMSLKTMDPAMSITTRDESARRIRSGDGIKSPAEVAAKDYPMLVTFGDINDPASVKLVDPADFAGSFGPGVRLKRITVAVTDEAVTSAIGNKFPWWEEFQNKHLDGSSTVATDLTTQNAAARLSLGSFTTELSK
jgi:hypothetical protein